MKAMRVLVGVIALTIAFALPVQANGTFTTPSGMKYVVQGAKGGSQGMVLLLHGAGDTPENFLMFNGGLVTGKGMIAVAPKSTGPGWVTQDTDKLVEVLEAVTKKYGVDMDRIHVFGHSSGAQMSLTLGLTRPKWFASIAAISGGLGITENMIDKAAVSIPIYLAHSIDDPTVPVDGSRRAKKILEGMGFDVTYYEKNGMGHLMDSDVRNRWIAWCAPKKRMFLPGNVGELDWQTGADLSAASATSGIGVVYFYDSKQNLDDKNCKKFEMSVVPDDKVKAKLSQVTCFKINIAEDASLFESLKQKKSPAVVVFRIPEDGGEPDVVKAFKGSCSASALVKAVDKAAKEAGVTLD
jgi:predicted esterase